MRIALTATALFAAVLAFGLFSPGILGWNNPDKCDFDIVLKLRSVFDGQSVIEGSAANVFINGNKIAAVGKIDPNKTVCQEINAQNLMALPGLIDLHTHLHSAPSFFPSKSMEDFRLNERINLKSHLYWGVTSVRSTGDDERFIFKLKQQLANKEILGPRLFAVGPAFTAKNGHPTELYDDETNLGMAIQIEPGTDPRPALERLKSLQADGVKVMYELGSKRRPYNKLDRSSMVTIVGEAKRLGFRVLGHVGTIRDAIELVDAGVDGLEHVPRGGTVEEEKILFARLKEQNVYINPTLSVIWGFFSSDEEKKTEFLANEIWKSIPKAWACTILNPTASIPPGPKQIWTEVLSKVSRAQNAAVPITVGSDSGVGSSYHGYGVHREMSLLVEAGLTPVEALTASTANAADHLGLAKELGRIAPGYLADIVLVEGDPTRNINDSKNVKSIIVDGQIKHRESLSFANEYSTDDLNHLCAQ